MKNFDISTWQDKHLAEASMKVGNQKIPAKHFKRYMKEYAKEISRAKEHFSDKDWLVAKKVAVYLIKSKKPNTVDEYLVWHKGAKAITGGKSFGMGSGFASASSLISNVIFNELEMSNKEADLWDGKILPYITKKAS